MAQQPALGTSATQLPTPAPFPGLAGCFEPFVQFTGPERAAVNWIGAKLDEDDISYLADLLHNAGFAADTA